jgi:excinuclease ABC subunit C
VHSVLDEVPGVGPARRRLLLSRFGSVEALRGADAEEIARRGGVPRSVAERIVDRLRPEEARGGGSAA